MCMVHTCQLTYRSVINRLYLLVSVEIRIHHRVGNDETIDSIVFGFVGSLTDMRRNDGVQHNDLILFFQ